MNDCSRVLPLLTLVADGEATPGERWRVRAHVGACSACRIQLARERRLSSVLRDWIEDEPDEAFTAEVMRGVARTPRRLRDRRGLRLAVFVGPWLAAAALTALSYTRAGSMWHGPLPITRWSDGIDPLRGAGGLLQLAWSSLHAVLDGAAGAEALQSLAAAAAVVLWGGALAATVAVACGAVVAATLCRGSRPAA